MIKVSKYYKFQGILSIKTFSKIRSRISSWRMDSFKLYIMQCTLCSLYIILKFLLHYFSSYSLAK